MPTADSWGNNQLKFVQVVKTEEKGSDVNLATHLLHDAYQDDYDVGVIVSNDSDLLEPIKIVKKVLRKIIGIINPQRHPSSVLVQQADFVKPVRKWVLGQSQFPQILKDARGSFSKPIGW